MSQNLDNISANASINMKVPLGPSYGSSSTLPNKPSFATTPIPSTVRFQPSTRLHSTSSSKRPPTINRTSYNGPQPPIGGPVASSVKGEDYDPNLENLKRINRPPAVVSTVSIPSSSKRRRDTHQAMQEGRRKGHNARNKEAVGVAASFRRNNTGRMHVHHPRQHSRKPEAKLHPARTQQPRTSGKESNSDMEIDDIDVFVPNIPPSMQTTGSATTSHMFTSPFANVFPSSSTIKRSAKYATSDSGDQQAASRKHPSVVRPIVDSASSSRSSSLQYPPSSSTRASTNTLYDSSPELPILLPYAKNDRTPNNKNYPGVTKRPSEFLWDQNIPKMAKRRCGPEGAVRSTPNVPNSTEQPMDHLSEGSCVWEETDFRRLWHARKQQSEDRNEPQRMDYLTRQEYYSGTTEQLALQTAREAKATLNSLPSTTDHNPSSRESEPEALTAPSETDIKEESPSPRPESPIDVDAPPLSLYEQLGLPKRTSGALRVPRPRFGKDDRAKKEKWSKEVADSIRWVRGRETHFAPLIIGNIFWRPDGVSFDWNVPPEELIRSTYEGRGSPVVVLAPPELQRPASTLPKSIDQGPKDPAPERLHARHITRDDLPIEEAIPSVIVKEEVVEVPISHPITDQTDTRGARSLNITPVASSQDIVADTTSDMPKSSHIAISTPHTLLITPLPHANPAFDSLDAMANIATCFLDRYTRCFDHINSRGKLADAYTEDAYMSVQFNDLPTHGSCLRVGQPKRQSHLIVNFADRDFGRNLLLNSDRNPRDRQYNWRTESSLCIGPKAIASRLIKFEALSHTVSPSSSRAYQFVVTPLKDLGILLLEYSGELYATRTGSDERYVSLRFQRVFLMRPNEPDAMSWVDWPWVIINDQMTLFHRPGIVCQCPP